MPNDTVKIVFADDQGITITTVSLYAEQTADRSITPIKEETPESCVEFGEAQIQLLEMASYEYVVNSNGYYLDSIPGIVKPSKVPKTKDRGRITTGLNAGRLQLRLLSDTDSTLCGTAEVEIRSVKIGYRDDYRNMLHYITERCADLLLEFRSPAEMKLEPEDTGDAETLCQRFAFIRSLLTSRDFRDAVNRLTTLPHCQWEQQKIVIPVNRGFQPKPDIARQIAAAIRRVPIPAAHPLAPRFSSVPEHLQVFRKIETVDTPENRFVKHALKYFQSVVVQVRDRLVQYNRQSDSRFIEEAERLEEQIGEYLNKDIFRSVTEPQLLPLSSPVLQRKGGYKEILKAWLQFDMAARLCWTGGTEVYSAGKRDVATLYEYWLFFKLLDLVAKLFDLNQPSAKSLIEETADGFGLKLKSGKHLALSGSYIENRGRKLQVKFSYNRTFSRKGSDPEKNFPVAGSWTERMRPDYTLTLWPFGFTEDEAERQEVIVHVHFDAKYRVENIPDIFGDPDESFKDNASLEDNVTEEKIGQREGKYKRADLLKAHAYKDAIRRTAGAYVLYPGTESKNWRGFHEIVPGLGAFGIRPAEDNEDGTEELKNFIVTIIKHVCDRATRREQETYHRYRIQDPESPDPLGVSVELDEYDINGRRNKPPSETPVLVGWFESEEQLRWTDKFDRIVFRVISREKRGAVALTPDNVGAYYILLHTKNFQAAPGLYAVRCDDDGRVQPPEILSTRALKEKYDYPMPVRSDYYIVYHVESAPQFAFDRWNIRKLLLRRGIIGISSALPFTATLDEVLNCACV